MPNDRSAMPARLNGADPVRGARRQAVRRAAALLGAVLAAALASVGAPVSAAGPEAAPGAGDAGAVLTVVVLDAAGAPRLRRDFDHAALSALPQHTLVATTPWYPQPHRFTGPLLRDVLAAAGATGGQMDAVALNDYRAEIPREDADRWPVIVARLVDGRPVAVRDKGPLMLMYPFDDDRSLRQSRFWGRAVWQLRTIELR